LNAEGEGGCFTHPFFHGWSIESTFARPTGTHKYPPCASRFVQFDVVIEKDETGAFIADVPVLPGCHTFGSTKQEALANIREAIELYLEAKGAPKSQFVSVEKVNVEA
jgi:predicted RNase H-like HicB family nuclease